MLQKNLKNNQYLVVILSIIYYYEIVIFVKSFSTAVKRELFMLIVFLLTHAQGFYTNELKIIDCIKFSLV